MPAMDPQRGHGRFLWHGLCFFLSMVQNAIGCCSTGLSGRRAAETGYRMGFPRDCALRARTAGRTWPATVAALLTFALILTGCSGGGGGGGVSTAASIGKACNESETRYTVRIDGESGADVTVSPHPLAD